MTSAERVRAVAEKGFTDRQAGFLVTVMLHSGVCVGRQYCVYARIVRGQKVHDFFASLVAKRFATSYAAAHRRAHIYHVHSKRLYAAIGEPNNRNRKPVTLARAVERLMVLDAVLAEPRLRWLGSRAREGRILQRGNDPQVERAAPSGFRTRTQTRPFGYFPDKLPIGVAATVAHTCSCTSSTDQRPWTSAPSYIVTPSCCEPCPSGSFGCSCRATW